VTRQLQTVVVTLAIALASTAFVRAQEKERPPATAIPLKVQVVIARYQGEKKISSMPYLLTMNVGQRSNLRMGTQVPVSVTSIDSRTTDGKPNPPPGPIQYRDVGTNIDCSAQALDDGRFQMGITVDDSSVYGDEQSGTPKGNPSFRSFRTVNSMVLRNGETFQFTAATDKVTGETVRVDVTLTVLK
jgi:type II secretory pathway component GspD/PulD (secretin)